MTFFSENPLLAKLPMRGVYRLSFEGGIRTTPEELHMERAGSPKNYVVLHSLSLVCEIPLPSVKALWTISDVANRERVIAQ